MAPPLAVAAWIIGFGRAWLADARAVRAGFAGFGAFGELRRVRQLRIESALTDTPGAPVRLVTVIHVDGGVVQVVDGPWLRDAPGEERAALFARHAAAVARRLAGLAGLLAMAGLAVRSLIMVAVAWFVASGAVTWHAAADWTEWGRDLLVWSLPSVVFGVAAPAARTLLAGWLRRRFERTMPVG